MAIKKLFTEQDQKRIQEAVKLAEEKTSGEIVPYVVERSDQYEVALYRAGLLGGGLGLVFALLFSSYYSGWGMSWLFKPQGTALVVAIATLLGFALGFIPAVRRLLTGRDALRRSVHGRAMQAFLEEEVFKTRERTGILLFVSLFEHHIEVIGDEGINRKVETSEWIEVVDTIRRGIRAGRPAEGMVDAIDRCGQLLETRQVEIRADDADELSNRVRLRKK